MFLAGFIEKMGIRFVEKKPEAGITLRRCRIFNVKLRTPKHLPGQTEQARGCLTGRFIKLEIRNM